MERKQKKKGENEEFVSKIICGNKNCLLHVFLLPESENIGKSQTETKTLFPSGHTVKRRWITAFCK